MRKHSKIFYDIFYEKYKDYLKIEEPVISEISNVIKERYKEWYTREFNVLSHLFNTVDGIDTDFNILKFFILNKNNVVFADHAPALRLYRQCCGHGSRGLLVLYKKNPSEKLKKIIKFHIDVLTHPAFFLKNHSNHFLDQVIAVIKYNDIFNDIKNISFYKSLFQEYINKCYTKNGIHVENTPLYHFYNFVQLSTFSQNIMYKKMLNYLYLCVAPNKKIINVGDGDFKSLSDSILDFKEDKKAFEEIQNKLDNYYDEKGFFYFDCGHLIIKYQDIYFFIKSSLKHKWHHHYDNNSFILFYKGYNFFIDAGSHSYKYESFGRKFVTSPQAHNLFVLNDNNKLLSHYGLRIIKGLYYCDSMKINENTYKFVSEYYKNIRYERIVNYNDEHKIFNFTDNISCIPEDYKYYYILFHLNRESKVKINNNEIDIIINDASIKLEIVSEEESRKDTTEEIIEENNLESINNLLDGDFDGMHIGYNSPERYEIVKTPTIVFKFKNNNKKNKHIFKISLL